MATESSVRRWMGVREVSEYLGLRPSTIYAMTHTRRIPHYKRGNILRFRQDEIDEWMEGGKIETEREYLTRITGGEDGTSA